MKKWRNNIEEDIKVEEEEGEEKRSRMKGGVIPNILGISLYCQREKINERFLQTMFCFCTQRPCIFSWPMVISNSVNEFFVAV